MIPLLGRRQRRLGLLLALLPLVAVSPSAGCTPPEAFGIAPRTPPIPGADSVADEVVEEVLVSLGKRHRRIVWLSSLG